MPPEYNPASLPDSVTKRIDTSQNRGLTILAQEFLKTIQKKTDEMTLDDGRMIAESILIFDQRNLLSQWPDLQNTLPQFGRDPLMWEVIFEKMESDAAIAGNNNLNPEQRQQATNDLIASSHLIQLIGMDQKPIYPGISQDNQRIAQVEWEKMANIIQGWEEKYIPEDNRAFKSISTAVSIPSVGSIAASPTSSQAPDRQPTAEPPPAATGAAEPPGGITQYYLNLGEEDTADEPKIPKVEKGWWKKLLAKLSRKVNLKVGEKLQKTPNLLDDYSPKKLSPGEKDFLSRVLSGEKSWSLAQLGQEIGLTPEELRNLQLDNLERPKHPISFSTADEVNKLTGEELAQLPAHTILLLMELGRVKVGQILDINTQDETKELIHERARKAITRLTTKHTETPDNTKQDIVSEITQAMEEEVMEESNMPDVIIVLIKMLAETAAKYQKSVSDDYFNIFSSPENWKSLIGLEQDKQIFNIQAGILSQLAEATQKALPNYSLDRPETEPPPVPESIDPLQGLTRPQLLQVLQIAREQNERGL